METWKEIKEVNGEYEVSNLGNVRSKQKKVVMHWFKSKPVRIKKGKMLKQTKKGDKYKVVTMYVKKHIQRYVHRLVAEHFIGKIDEGYNVNHIDGNKDNNNVNNLEIITCRSNSIHAQLDKKQSSKYVGVYYNKARRKYVAFAREKGGKKKYLGGFDDDYQAHLAYIKFIDNNTKDTQYHN